MPPAATSKTTISPIATAIPVFEFVVRGADIARAPQGRR
jgi:hypothetical protein